MAGHEATADSFSWHVRAAGQQRAEAKPVAPAMAREYERRLRKAGR